MKLSLRTRPQPGVAIPRMFGNLQENLRPVHETGLKPWGIATEAVALVRNDTSFSVRFTERQTPISQSGDSDGYGSYGVDLISIQPGVEVVKDDLRPLLHGFFGRKGDMGGDDGVGTVQQRMIEGQGRLGLKHIAGRSRDVAFCQCLGERSGVHHAASRGIDQQSGLFHQRELRFSDEPSCLLRQGAVERDNIRKPQKLLQ